MGIREAGTVSIGAVSKLERTPSSSDSTPNATGGDLENVTFPKNAISKSERNLTGKKLWNYASSFLGHDQRLASPTSTCILVNFISIGYILNPFAFSQGGLLLSTICLALISFQSFVSGTFVLEACARAEALKHFDSASDLSKENAIDWANVLNEEEKEQQQRHHKHDFTMIIEERTFEISELCRIFLGKWMKYFFTFTTAGDLYGVTWTLAVVFASSLADKIPMGTKWDYELYVAMFVIVCVPISCLRIVGQVRLQLFFLAARTVMVLLMITTTIAAFVSEEPHFGEHVGPVKGDVPLAKYSNMVSVLQTCVFSTAFQFAVPGIAAETKNKTKMASIIRNSATYIFVTNLILSLLLASFFGSDSQESSNLNWVNYHGGTWDGENLSSRAWWASGISAFVVSFAALDGLAVYPLVAVSLGDILMGAFYEDEIHDIHHRHWKKRVFFRILASLPQGVGALFVRDLGTIALYAGIFTLLSYTVCPSILAIKSRKALERAGLGKETFYSTPFSSRIWAWALIVAAEYLIIAVIVQPFVSS